MYKRSFQERDVWYTCTRACTFMNKHMCISVSSRVLWSSTTSEVLLLTCIHCTGFTKKKVSTPFPWAITITSLAVQKQQLQLLLQLLPPPRLIKGYLEEVLEVPVKLRRTKLLAPTAAVARRLRLTCAGRGALHM